MHFNKENIIIYGLFDIKSSLSSSRIYLFKRAEIIGIKPAPKHSKKIQKLTSENPDRQFLEEPEDSGQVTGEYNSRDLQKNTRKGL